MSGDSSGESGDIFGLCLEKLPYNDVVRAKLVSKFFKNYIESNTFNRDREKGRSVEFSLTALHFFFEDGGLHCSGLDLASRRWRRLPPLTYLPTQWKEDWQDLSTQAAHDWYRSTRYLIAASGGLLCIRHFLQERLIVCNPLTQESVVLPCIPLYPDTKLLHLLPNPATKSFKVIVVCSDAWDLCTKVFDSLLWKWTETRDKNFWLTMYQTGVCKDGILYSPREDWDYRVSDDCNILYAYDLEKGGWIWRWRCRLPLQSGRSCRTAQLVENDRDIFIFVEETRPREEGPVQVIAKLETFPDPEGKVVVGKWKIIMRRTMGQPRNWEEPEDTCVPYGVGKLCIFNIIDHTGVVYDVANQREDEHVFPSPPASHRQFLYHSLNPLSCSFQAGDYTRCVPRHAAVQANPEDINFTLSASQERSSRRQFRQGLSREKRKLYTPSHTTEEGLQICNFLSNDLLKDCLVKLPLIEDLYPMKPVSKPMKQCIESEHFQFHRGKALANEGLLTAVYFTGNESGEWQGRGFDLLSNKWMRLPPFLISSQAADSSSQTSYLIAGGGFLTVRQTRRNLWSTMATYTFSYAKDSHLKYNPFTGLCNFPQLTLTGSTCGCGKKNREVHMRAFR